MGGMLGFSLDLASEVLQIVSTLLHSVIAACFYIGLECLMCKGFSLCSVETM